MTRNINVNIRVKNSEAGLRTNALLMYQTWRRVRLRSLKHRASCFDFSGDLQVHVLQGGSRHLQPVKRRRGLHGPRRELEQRPCWVIGLELDVLAVDTGTLSK